MVEGKMIRLAYGETLEALGHINEKIVVLDADVSGSTKSGIFAATFPNRFFNVGISEANMAGMAAGLATTGKIPFINTFAAFMSLRAGDPIRTLISYGKLNVKIAGAYAGMSDSYDGATHHSITDISFMRSLPNMTVFVASCPTLTKKAVEFAVDHEGPMYLRLSREPMPYHYEEDFEFEMGKGYVHKEGTDITLIATGYMLTQALEAAKILEDEGVSVRVVDMYWIKPFDVELARKCARETGRIVTCEEHNIFGGLASAVAEAVQNENVQVRNIAIQDTFTSTGAYQDLIKKYELDPISIVNKARELLG